jgi:hypothetical protein
VRHHEQKWRNCAAILTSQPHKFPNILHRRHNREDRQVISTAQGTLAGVLQRVERPRDHSSPDQLRPLYYHPGPPDRRALHALVLCPALLLSLPLPLSLARSLSWIAWLTEIHIFALFDSTDALRPSGGIALLYYWSDHALD